MERQYYSILAIFLLSYLIFSIVFAYFHCSLSQYLQETHNDCGEKDLVIGVKQRAILNTMVNKLIQDEKWKQKEKPRSAINRAKILCMILTLPANYEKKLKNLMNSWGKHCDHALLVTSKSAKDQLFDTKSTTVYRIGLEKEDRRHIWFKVRSGLIYAYTHFLEQFEWFFRVDDDVFVLLENMKRFLAYKNHSENLYYGFKYKIYGGYLAGSSQILSRKALKTIVEKGFNSTIVECTRNSSVEDVVIGICMRKLKVSLHGVFDNDMKQMIVPLNVRAFLTTLRASVPDWFHEWSQTDIERGMNCCSKDPISYHYVSKEFEQNELDFFTRELNRHNLT